MTKSTYTAASNSSNVPFNGTLPSRSVLVALSSTARLTDTACLLDVFTEANSVAADRTRYDVRIRYMNKNPNANFIQNSMHVCGNEPDDGPESTDTFIVAGPDNSLMTCSRFGDLKWLREQTARSRRTVGIAGGSFLLAAAGLINERKVATHWTLQDQMRRAFPRVNLQPDILFAQDEHIFTCAGAVASIELGLKLVEDDVGCEVASAVASRMLLHFRRSACADQISQLLRAQAAASDSISKLVAWLPDHLSEKLCVRTMARRAAMSPRNFARMFRQQVGTTPAKFVAQLRLDAAQRELGNTKQTVGVAAALGGFTNTETFRRLFRKHLQMTPGQFRQSQVVNDPTPRPIA